MSLALFLLGSGVAAALGFVLFVLMDPVARLPGMSESGSDLMVRIVVGFAATLAGVVLGAMYRELRRRQAAGQTEIAVLPFFRDMRKSLELWLGLVGSPLVFALLLRSTAGMDLLGMVITALENGFCCLIILNALIERHQAEPKPQPASTRKSGKS
jgi:hypothetical protein